jgi:hypothetical protein
MESDGRASDDRIHNRQPSWGNVWGTSRGGSATDIHRHEVAADGCTDGNLVYAESFKIGKPPQEINVFLTCLDRLCGLVVRVPGCRPRGPGVDSRRYEIF